MMTLKSDLPIKRQTWIGTISELKFKTQNLWDCIHNTPFSCNLQIDRKSKTVTITLDWRGLPETNTLASWGEGKITYIVSAHFRCVVSLFGKLS